MRRIFVSTYSVKFQHKNFQIQFWNLREYAIEDFLLKIPSDIHLRFCEIDAQNSITDSVKGCFVFHDYHIKDYVRVRYMIQLKETYSCDSACMHQSSVLDFFCTGSLVPDTFRAVGGPLSATLRTLNFFSPKRALLDKHLKRAQEVLSHFSETLLLSPILCPHAN